MLLLQKVSDLPLEMLEAVLMRAFLMMYVSDIEVHDGGRVRRMPGKSRSAERRSFTLLASVCSGWHQTLVGWPQSSTPRWLGHQLKKLIEREYMLAVHLIFC